jgi:hypothetical protein
MPKNLAGVLAVLMAALLFAACGGRTSDQSEPTKEAPTTSQTTTTLPGRLPSEPLSVAGAVEPRHLLVTWSPPQDDGGSAIVQYRIDTSQDGSTWENKKFVYAQDPREYKLEWIGRPRYLLHVRVAAMNAVGTGPSSKFEVQPEVPVEEHWMGDVYSDDLIARTLRELCDPYGPGKVFCD